MGQAHLGHHALCLLAARKHSSGENDNPCPSQHKRQQHKADTELSVGLRMPKKKCTSNFTGRRSSVDKKMFHDLLLRIKVISSVLGAFSTGNARWEIIVLCGVATGSLLYGPTFLF